MTAAQMARRAARCDLLSWAARIGAVTAEALAERVGCSQESARRRLAAAERDGHLHGQTPLASRPRLYTVTRSGLAEQAQSGWRPIAPSRVTAANAAHAIACALVAARLERAFPGCHVVGEPQLRCEERDRGVVVAAARLRRPSHGKPVMHRPDLLLRPGSHDPGPAVAVEVELTRKSPERLLAICRAWARARCVAGVLYLAAPEVVDLLERCVERAMAGDSIAVLELSALGPSVDAFASPVPGAS